MNNKVEFKLRFLLNSLTLRVLNMEDISDPKRVLSFNNRFCDSRKIQAFCTEITDATSFPLLGVPLTPNSKIHKVYFCEISVGKSLFVSQEYANTLDLPKDCDSFIISKDECKGFLTDIPVDASKLFYVIKDPSRVLPLYEVTFEYDEEFERLSRNSFICNRCKMSEAVMFCPSERASFCAECDSQVHHDDFLKRHKRLYFSEVGQKKFICCSTHPTRVIEYFCETCMEPLCTDCKITGNHSGREKYEHPVTPFLDACQMLKSKILECTMPVGNLIEDCSNQMQRFREKVNNFKGNIAAVRAQLEKEFTSLKQQLDSIEDRERQATNAKYAERISKAENLRKMKEYPQTLDPADLLSEFKSIQDLTHSESMVVFDKYDPEKVETQGKIALVVPKAENCRVYPSDSKDKAIRWRIETMHMTNEQDPSLN